jgi:hypothetical protein
LVVCVRCSVSNSDLSQFHTNLLFKRYEPDLSQPPLTLGKAFS